MKEKVFGYNQIELKKLGIKTDELLILQHFVDFQKSGNMDKYQINGKEYYWLSYKKVMEDLPMLDITNIRTIQRKFDKLVEVNILEKEYHREKEKTFTLFRKGKAYDQIIYRHDENKGKPTPRPERPYKEIIGYLNEVTNKNLSLPDTSKVLSYNDIEYIDLIDRLYLAGYTLEDIKHVISVKSQQWLNNDDMKNTLNPRTLFNLDKGYFQKYIKEKLKPIEKEEVLVLSRSETFV